METANTEAYNVRLCLLIGRRIVDIFVVSKPLLTLLASMINLIVFTATYKSAKSLYDGQHNKSYVKNYSWGSS